MHKSEELQCFSAPQDLDQAEVTVLLQRNVNIITVRVPPESPRKTNTLHMKIVTRRPINLGNVSIVLEAAAILTPRPRTTELITRRDLRTRKETIKIGITRKTKTAIIPPIDTLVNTGMVTQVLYELTNMKNMTNTINTEDDESLML